MVVALSCQWHEKNLFLLYYYGGFLVRLLRLMGTNIFNIQKGKPVIFGVDGMVG